MFTAIWQPRETAETRARASRPRMHKSCLSSECTSADWEPGSLGSDNAYFPGNGAPSRISSVARRTTNHIAGFEIAHHLDEIAVGRTLFHIHPLGFAIASANYEGALGGGDHGGLGDEQRRP